MDKIKIVVKAKVKTEPEQRQKIVVKAKATPKPTPTIHKTINLYIQHHMLQNGINITLDDVLSKLYGTDTCTGMECNVFQLHEKLITCGEDVLKALVYHQ